jgi:hypothetical protein
LPLVWPLKIMDGRQSWNRGRSVPGSPHGDGLVGFSMAGAPMLCSLRLLDDARAWLYQGGRRDHSAGLMPARAAIPDPI